MELAKIIGSNVQRIRKSRGWSQTDLCKEVSWLSTPRLSQIEAGKKQLTIKSVQKLADILDVRPFELLVDHDEKTSALSDMFYLVTNLPKKEREALTKIMGAVLKSNGLMG